MNIPFLSRHRLQKITEKSVIQGPEHQENIVEMMRIISEAARNEFYEDNEYTIREFLKECLDEALDQSKPQYKNVRVK